MSRRRVFMMAVVIVPYLAVLAGGCGVIHRYSASNIARAGGPGPVTPTRARLRLAPAELPEGVFVGIAMSGGGARAANFSTATLLELEELGFLPYATALSAVSGSALAAAYYGVYGRVDQPATERQQRWNADTVRERFVYDFQSNWIARWFNPWNIVRYWFTDFDRSDIMEQTFDAHLFRERPRPRFKDMGHGLPRILINATSLPDVGAFVFTDEALERIGSRLDEYPLTHAVMASGAFPGAFHNVTLRDFDRPGYFQHLFDGGPSDNLGVHILLDMIDAVKPTRGCFLFVVDAYTYNRGKGERLSDTRRFFDFVVDQNALAASDVFLTLRRYDTLRDRLGYPGDEVGAVPQWDFTTRGGIACRVWHLTFQSLLVRRDKARTAATQQARDNLAAQLEKERQRDQAVNLVPTRYRLEGPEDMNMREVQSLIYGVADHLLRDDDDMLRRACRWFNDHHLPACALAGEAAN
jgi:predicted acylesterase/phospholipase RssA